jgi:phosphatidylglycerophosphatase A
MHDKTWYGIIATLSGLGNVGRMPGTLGSVAAMLVLIALGGVNIIVLLAVIGVGTIAADRYAKERGLDDPREVVVDEVAGYWTSMLGLGVSDAATAFFLFRVIDMIKPFPVDSLERLPGGLGIMADDLCGGLMVNAIMRVMSWLLFSGGFGAICGVFGAGS